MRGKEKLGEGGDEGDIKSRVEAAISVESIDEEPILRMLAEMEVQIKAVNNSPEILDNGYKYPVVWYENFKKRLLSDIDSYNKYAKDPNSWDGEIPLKPEVRLFGYGSLITPSGRNENIKGEIGSMPVITDCSEMLETDEGTGRTYLFRNLWLSGSARTAAEIEQFGVDDVTNNGVAAVKAQMAPASESYDPEREINGILLAPLPAEQMQDVYNREFAYYFLPGPPMKTVDGEHAFKFTLICWPIGRTLIDNGYQKADGQTNTHSRDIFRKKLGSIKLNEEDNILGLTTEEILEFYDLFGENETSADEYISNLASQKGDFEESQIKGQQRILHRLVGLMDNFYNLDEKIVVEPNVAYILGSCLQYGRLDKETIRRFLNTTWYKKPDGEIDKVFNLTFTLEKSLKMIQQFSVDLETRKGYIKEHYGEIISEDVDLETLFSNLGEIRKILREIRS